MWCFFCCTWLGLVVLVVVSVVVVDDVVVDVVGVYVEVVVDMVLVVVLVHVIDLEVVAVGGGGVPKRGAPGGNCSVDFSFGCVTTKCPKRITQCFLFAANPGEHLQHCPETPGKHLHNPGTPGEHLHSPGTPGEHSHSPQPRMERCMGKESRECERERDCEQD